MRKRTASLLSVSHARSACAAKQFPKQTLRREVNTLHTAYSTPKKNSMDIKEGIITLLAEFGPCAHEENIQVAKAARALPEHEHHV